VKKRLFLGLLVGLILNLLTVSGVFACVGARPLAMGGAFVGVADDVNATYWNPAGLTQVDEFQLAYTPTLYNRNEVNYDDFVSLVFPLSSEEQTWGNLGISFVNSGFEATSSEIIDKWYWFSYGVKLPLNLSFGANLRQREYEWKINQGYVITGTTIAGPIEDSDKALSVDLALFWKWDKLSLGLLWQDVDESEFDLFNNSIKLKCVKNLRPGLAFRPDDKTIFSVELYDITSETSSSNGNVRLGIERWFDLPFEGAALALRAGGYDINADDKANRAITGGLGCKLAQNESQSVTFSMDYAVMYWTDATAGAEDLTHMMGFKVSFPWE